MKKQSRIKVEVLRDSGFGKVPGLDDDELADYYELLRQVMTEQWAPLLDIPIRKSGYFVKPAIDESGELDWGAFGTVDFQKMFPFNKARYKVDKLREELRNTMIAFNIIKERLPVEARLETIRHIRNDKDIDDLENHDMWFLARRYLQARRLLREIHHCCGK